jgi:hypothetical protein
MEYINPEIQIVTHDDDDDDDDTSELKIELEGALDVPETTGSA